MLIVNVGSATAMVMVFVMKENNELAKNSLWIYVNFFGISFLFGNS